MEKMNVIKLETRRKDNGFKNESDTENMMIRFEKMMDRNLNTILDAQNRTTEYVNEFAKKIDEEMKLERIEREKLYNKILDKLSTL